MSRCEPFISPSVKQRHERGKHAVARIHWTPHDSTQESRLSRITEKLPSLKTCTSRVSIFIGSIFSDWSTVNSQCRNTKVPVWLESG